MEAVAFSDSFSWTLSEALRRWCDELDALSEEEWAEAVTVMDTFCAEQLLPALERMNEPDLACCCGGGSVISTLRRYTQSDRSVALFCLAWFSVRELERLSRSCHSMSCTRVTCLRVLFVPSWSRV